MIELRKRTPNGVLFVYFHLQYDVSIHMDVKHTFQLCAPNMLCIVCSVRFCAGCANNKCLPQGEACMLYFADKALFSRMMPAIVFAMKHKGLIREITVV